MPPESFRGDPYRVLDVAADATDATIKRRWRQLASEHHPDRAGDPTEAARLTERMARINATMRRPAGADHAAAAATRPPDPGPRARTGRRTWMGGRAARRDLGPSGR